MTVDLLARRLRAQRLAGRPAATPAEVVAWLGAVQAQDFRGALWAIAQRTRGATEADVEQALADRAIVRTWPMRNTLHFVAPADIRWLLALLAPRMRARTAGRHRELGLDARTFTRARGLLERALAGGQALTRDEAYATLTRGRVSTAGQRGIHLVAKLAIDGVLCFGALRGKQQTFVLLDDWVPATPARDRDDALAELAARYAASHGPATAADFAWWSGLALADARRGLQAGDLVERHGMWDSARRAAAVGSQLRLLPAYDEYTVGYRDRSAILDAEHAAATRNGIFTPVVVQDGRIAGTWARAIGRREVTVTVAPLARIDRGQLARAVDRYGAFLGLPVQLRAGLPR